MRDAGLALTLLLFACSRSGAPANGATSNTHSPTAREITTTSLPEKKPEVADPAKDLLQEPNGPIDPKSAEAAGQVVQSYGALIEQNRWTEANALWADSGQAAKFKADFAQLADLHLEIGNLGEPEGAAGSIYVSMPVIFYGDTKSGQPFRRSADVTLRRVNDVPGSTEAQRRWHIERIDWAG